MTDLKVVDFKPKKKIEDANQQSGENVIERLEELLTIAKEGRISNMAYAITYHPSTDDKAGAIATGWANGEDVFVLPTAIEVLKKDFMAANIEEY